MEFRHAGHSVKSIVWATQNSQEYLVTNGNVSLRSTEICLLNVLEVKEPAPLEIDIDMF